MSVTTKFGASYSRPGSFEGIYRKIADRAAEKAEEREAIKALVAAPPVERHYTKSKTWKAKRGLAASRRGKFR